MSEFSQTVRLGTRGSLLARTQSQVVASELEKLHPGLAVELVIFKTQGDVNTQQPLYEFGGKGLFTQELEQALLAGEIDFAVHSFKDVPVTMPLVDQTQLVFAAVPQREDPRDVLVSLKARRIMDLPEQAKVGTGSLRRRSQLLAQRADLVIEPVRGNIDTRLRRLREGEFDAMILAAAGLRRAGLFDETEMTILEPEEMLPAPGQGALAIQARIDNQAIAAMLAPLNDASAQLCVTAERSVVEALHGDCHSPIGALARLDQNEFDLCVAVGGRDGRPPVVFARSRSAANRPDEAVAGVLKYLSDKDVAALLGTLDDAGPH